MAKKLSKKQNIKKWKKGLKTKAINISNDTSTRKGTLLT